MRLLDNCFLITSYGWLTSSTSSTILENVKSCKVDLNASTIYAGSLLMKPTVSDMITVLSLSFMARLTVDRVVNNPESTNLDSPVSRLNNVVFPAEVYPAIEIVGNPCLTLPNRCNSFLFSSFINFLLRTVIL